jgi:hypothetical protein
MPREGARNQQSREAGKPQSSRARCRGWLERYSRTDFPRAAPRRRFCVDRPYRTLSLTTSPRRES